MRRRPRLPATLIAPLLAFVLIAAAGCGSPGAQAPSPDSDPAGAGTEPPSAEGTETDTGSGEQGPVLTLIYSHPGTGLTLGVPEGWEVYPLEDAVVAMISPVRGEEDFFRENIMVTADDQFPDLTLERYVEVLADEVKNRYPDTETLESGDITIADAEGRWMVDRFTGPKGEARVYRVVLVREGTAYVLHGTAPVWTFDDYRPVFEAVARSATWIDPRLGDDAEPGDQP